MAGHRHHHSSKKNTLQIVVVPEDDAAKGFSFSAVRWHLIAGAAGVCVLIGLVSVALVVFTPLGRVIPVSDAELAHRYGSELVSLQHRVVRLSEEMLVMRDYNRKLRVALGDATDTDSLMDALSEHLAASSDHAPQASSPAASQGAMMEPSGAQTSKRASAAGGDAHRAASGRVQEGEATDVMPMPAATSRSFRASFPISAPVAGYITRTFQNDKLHFGVDYAGKRGTVITAAADGYVIFSNWTQEDGNIIILSHGSGYVTVYQHNQALLKQQGEFVRRGTPIALLGDSGTTSSGPHLHFEIWKDGQPQDPNEYLIASEK
ncbi:MAG: M23 family metallopeptidase [Acidobacteriota bacterium]